MIGLMLFSFFLELTVKSVSCIIHSKSRSYQHSNEIYKARQNISGSLDSQCSIPRHQNKINLFNDEIKRCAPIIYLLLKQAMCEKGS